MNNAAPSRLRHLAGKVSTIFGLTVVLFYVAIALAAPWLAPSPADQDPAVPLVIGSSTDMVPHPPGGDARLGTLPGQIDIYHSLVWGTRSALLFGLSVVVCAAVFGSLSGAAGAYWGGWANQLVLRLTDTFLTVPLVAGVYFCKQFLNLIMRSAGAYFFVNGEVDTSAIPQPLASILLGINPILIGFILFSWMPYARLTNSLVLRLRRADFVQAAQALGAGQFFIVLRHLIPNAISPSITLAARDISMVVILQATLQFIGLDIVSGWGQILYLARSYLIAPGGDIIRYWWLFLPVTLALVLFSVAWNLLGDALNDWLNPHHRTAERWDNSAVR